MSVFIGKGTFLIEEYVKISCYVPDLMQPPKVHKTPQEQRQLSGIDGANTFDAGV